ncbi:MAG: methionine sulfoxide reductase heme-binding subunit [Pseudomonadota bacterium]|nr:methionine sulfoxide reductase heme-binding subunit [Pseudomonadota bacterium]
MTLSNRQLATLKITLFLLALIPAAHLGWRAMTDGLGANPVEELTRNTGTWTFNFLLLTLSITPLRALTGQHWLTRLRRMLGLFAFFYGTLHFSTFIGFEHMFDVNEMLKDVLKRPFVTVGFAAFVLLIPLAATSFNRAIRWLGGKRWQELHRSIYAIGILATVHYFWLVKITAIQWPLLYAAMLAILLGWRARERMRRYGPFPKTPTVQPIRIVDTSKFG